MGKAASTPEKRGRSAKGNASARIGPAPSATSDAIVGFEAALWQMADKLRNNMDAAEYKHVVLGLLFLKYVSDTAIEDHGAPIEEPREPGSRRDANPVRAPNEARWAFLEARAGDEAIGEILDAAMLAIERDNPALTGVLPKDYARPTLDKTRLGELVRLVGTIGLGDRESRSRDVLGRVYEYFLAQFAAAEGKNGGQFYTPRSVVRVLASMLAPYTGRIFDPCCGSGGMFVQSDALLHAHGGRTGDVTIYGQESNHTTYRLAKLNLAIRGIDAKLVNADSLHADGHPDLQADYVLANPPFNDSDWGAERLKGDIRWKYGVPPAKNANYAWVQHFIHHLSPGGMAGIVLANGSMSSRKAGEGEIRRALVEADLVDCMVALPGQLFYSTQIPVCLWILARDKQKGAKIHGIQIRDRRRETLFIDARRLGTLVDRSHRELSEEEIAKIAETYHRFRGDGAGPYEDAPGFCKRATTAEIASNQFALTPGRYVGAPEVEGDREPFDEKMKRLTAELEEQIAEGAHLQREILSSLRGLGYGS